MSGLGVGVFLCLFFALSAHVAVAFSRVLLECRDFTCRSPAHAMAEPVVWTWNDIIWRPPTKGSVTSRAAHKVLDDFRSEASGPFVDVPGGRQQVSVKDDKQSLDLKDGTHFDWWSYLANHPDGQKVVGQGVTNFELMFLDAVDHNTKQRRLDFNRHPGHNQG